MQELSHPTGDVGYFDGKSLILCGRVKDIINVNGIKIVPSKIEMVLKEYPRIEEDLRVY